MCVCVFIILLLYLYIVEYDFFQSYDSHIIMSIFYCFHNQNKGHMI